MIDEGYIKFDLQWDQTEAFPSADLSALNDWRDQLYALHFLGAYPDGIGFGNISQRIDERQFYISGSTTGNFAQLSTAHYAKVIDFDLDKNFVHCEGPIKASSESMSHAVIYQTCPSVNAVFHLHHKVLWKKLLYQVPTTAANIKYGTPAMAYEIIRLLQSEQLREQDKFFVMAGHEEGIFTFGESLAEAGKKLLQSYQKLILHP
ncbi:MAG: class II aldolase/adducin family protein [Saprospiraceae bacterium]